MSSRVAQQRMTMRQTLRRCICARQDTSLPLTHGTRGEVSQGGAQKRELDVKVSSRWLSKRLAFPVCTDELGDQALQPFLSLWYLSGAQHEGVPTAPITEVYTSHIPEKEPRPCHARDTGWVRTWPRHDPYAVAHGNSCGHWGPVCPRPRPAASVLPGCAAFQSDSAPESRLRLCLLVPCISR